ncbi:MAG TPA: hypothetical protein ENK83_03155, partial [Aliiroseovarius sp.]|nr:hypothetical protein [Aliiroseovarius sp.]
MAQHSGDCRNAGGAPGWLKSVAQGMPVGHSGPGPCDSFDKGHAITAPMHPAFRTTPDLSVSTANPGEIAPELHRAHRTLGKLVVNRWTYRILRWLGGLMMPPFDKGGVTLRLEAP